jgi:hypothetical protein
MLSSMFIRRDNKLKHFILVIISFIILTLPIAISGEVNPRLSKVYDLSKTDYISSISMTNKGLQLFSIFNDTNEDKIQFDVYSVTGQKRVKMIQNATNGTYSPDGKYYTYIQNEKFFLCSKTDKKIKVSIPIKGMVKTVIWSYDSKNVFINTLGKKYIIYRFNISSKSLTEVLSSNHIYFNPVTVRDSNILYLLENKEPEIEGWDCNIVKYDLNKKIFEQVKIPEINDLSIWDSFTISPDEKLIIFESVNDGIIYFTDKTTLKIIDKISTPMNSQPGAYCWKPDGSYVLFTMTLKEIYQYSFK